MTKPTLRSRLTSATTATTNLVVAGTAAVGAAALHSLPVLAVGGAAYAALVAWDFVSGSGNKKAGEAPRVRVAGPKIDPLSVADEPTRATLRVIVTARASIDRLVAEAPPDVNEQLESALASLAELEERAAHLARRADGVARYLKTADLRALEGDCHALAARVARATDEETRTQLSSALKARREHLEVVVELGRTKERIDATLLSIASTLDGLAAKIVRATDAETTVVTSDAVKEELDRMNIEIGTFEETLKSLAELEA